MGSNRRQALRVSLAAATAASASLSEQLKGAGEAPVSGFPVYSVLDFGAKPDGITLNTAPLQRALDRATGLGGGVVYLPPGNYLTGTILLRDNVTLYLEAGATIWASKNRQDYTQRSAIYAENVTNAAIRGRGTIDGSGTSFWKREANRWNVGEWRPAALMTLVKCANLLLEHVTVRNPPAWAIHPIECDGLSIHGISILAGIYEDDGPNTDGIDPDGCTNVRISDCYIQCGDDAIVLKCGRKRGEPGGRRICRGVTVTNCVLITTETALKIGSESYGEFQNITFSNCAIRDAGCGIGLWMRDGGLIDGWTVNNVSMTLTRGGQPIYMTSYPRSRLPERGQPPDEEKPPGIVRSVMISNVEATGCGGMFLQGMMEKRLEGITLENVRLHVRGGRDKKRALNTDPPYPFPVWGHRISPYGIYCRYVDDLTLRNIQVNWGTPEDAEWGSAIRCRSVNGLEIDGFVGRQSAGSDAPAIVLADTRNAFIHNCWAPEGAGTFLRLEEGCQNVSLMNNDLHRAQQATLVGPGGNANELYAEGNRLLRR